MITSVQFVAIIDGCHSLLSPTSSRRFRQASSASAEIEERNPAEDEPPRPQSSFDRAADFRSPDAWMIAYRDFRDAETAYGRFQDQLHGPPIGCLLELDRPEHLCAGGAERPKVGDLEPVKTVDQFCGEPVAKHGMPGQGAGRTRSGQAGTDADVGASFDDRSEEKRKFRGSIAVIAVQKSDDIGSVDIGQSRQACASVAVTRFRYDSRAHPGGDGGGFIR